MPSVPFLTRREMLASLVAAPLAASRPNIVFILMDDLRWDELRSMGNPIAEDTKELRKTVWEDFLPNKVLVQASQADSEARQSMPLLQGRVPLNNRATAFVCEHYSCKQPVTEPDDLRRQLAVAAATGSA